MDPNDITKENLSEEISVIFSEDEIDIINKVINTIHNDKNSIYLDKTFYRGAFILIDSLKNGMMKELENNHNIDSFIIKSFEEKNTKENIQVGRKIDNVNISNFPFEWYDWYDFRDKKTLLKDYEIISISGIGFNEEKTKAIIFLQIEYDNDGNGKIYVLEKVMEKWEIVKIIDLFGIIKKWT
jgi:hypothetical protein